MLVLGALGMLVYMALQVGAITGPRETVDVEIVLTDAAGLGEGAVVAIAGVQVGRVGSMRVDFDRARAAVSLDARAGIRSDARFAIRARSVLGEKYLEVAPVGRDAPLLRDGDVIEVAEDQVEIDELVTRIGPLLASLDPEVVRGATAALASAIQQDPERPARMLADAERALHNAAEASDALPALVGDARATLASVRRTSDDARPLLAQLEASATRLDTLLAGVPPEQIPATIAELQAAVREGRAVVEKLDGGAADLEELLHKANGVTDADLRRLLREEGVLIRFREKKVE